MPGENEQHAHRTKTEKSRWTRFTHIALVVVVIGAGIWIWEELLEDHIIPKRWGVVEPGKIYRSGQLSATLVKKTLKKHNIAVIVNLCGNVPGDKDQEAEKRAAAELGIEMLRFPLKGNGTGDIRNYAQAIAAIVDAKKQGKPVLVHCAAGAQRTGGVIACYRVLVEKKPPSFAYTELVRYGWDPDDDQALLTYINDNMSKLTSQLRAMGIIEQLPRPLPMIRSQQKKKSPSPDTVSKFNLQADPSSRAWDFQHVLYRTKCQYNATQMDYGHFIVIFFCQDSRYCFL